MAEGQNPELAELLSHVEIQLSVSGIDDVAEEFKDLCRNEKDALKDARKLEAAYGSLENAAKALVKRHNERKKAAADANKSTLSGLKKLTKEVKRYGAELGAIAAKTVMPSNMGNAVSLTLDYNKSILSTSASVNRLGIGVGLLEKSLGRVGRETHLTRVETTALFDKYQEGMRFVSLQQFEGMLKRIQSIVGSNAKEMEKYQSAIASVSQEYPALAQGLASLKKASGSVASSEKAVLQSRIRNLYFVGKIKDAEYKRLTSFISGNQQILGADKRRQQEMQSQIAASQIFKREWESVSITFGKALLPMMEKVSGHVEKFNNWLETSNISATKLAVSLGLAYGAFKIGSGALGVIGGGLKKGGGKAIGGLGRAGGGLLSSMFGRKGGAVGKIGRAVSGGAGAVLGGDGTKVYVTNWPLMLGGGSLGANAGPQLPGKGGMVGKLGGFMSKGGKLAKLGKGVGIGALLGLGSWGAKKGAEALEARGHTKTAGFTEAAGGGLGAGSLAMTGAAIGSFILPGVGTAIGAGLGGLIGVVANLDSLTGGFKKLFGKSEKVGKDAKPLSNLAATIKADMARAATAEADLNKQQRSDVAAMYTHGVAKVFEAISADIAEQDKKVKALRKEVDVEVAMKFEKKGLGTIKKQMEVVARMREEIDKKGDYKGNSKQKEADDATLKAATGKLKKMQDIRNTAEENNTEYMEAVSQFGVMEGRLANINTLMSKQRDIAESIKGLYTSQTSKLDAMVTMMSITGDIDPAAAFKIADSAIKTLDAEMIARRNIIKMIDAQGAAASGFSQKELDSNKKLTKEKKYVYEAVAALKMTGMDQIEVLAIQNDQEARLLSTAEERSKVYGKIRDIYNDTLQLTQAQATGASLLVQLADNYAIGVGASVTLRKKEFDAQSEIIGILRDRFKTEQQAYQRSVQTYGVNKDNMRLRVTMKETENEILQAQIKQASSVKSMRDAWISAISAMNTGMDSFSEIIMNAEQNTAMVQQLDGAVRSSLSGATAIRDVFGRITERGVGFLGSEQMNVRGDIAARGGRKLSDISYETGRGIDQNTSRRIEAALRGGFREMSEDMAYQSGRVRKGSMKAQAVGANKMVKSVQAAQDSFKDSVVEASQEASENLQEGGKKAAKNMTPSGGGASRSGAGAGSLMDMSPGFRDIKLKEPKGLGEWAQAMKDAPRDTLPRLVVNSKSNAVPVFVVNLKDMDGSSISKNIVKEQNKSKKSKEVVGATTPEGTIKREKAIIAAGQKELVALESKRKKMVGEDLRPFKITQRMNAIKSDIASSEKIIQDIQKAAEPKKKPTGPTGPAGPGMLARQELSPKEAKVQAEQQKYNEDELKHTEKLNALKSQLAKTNKTIAFWAPRTEGMVKARETLAETGYFKHGSPEERSKDIKKGRKYSSELWDLKQQKAGKQRVAYRPRAREGAYVPGSAWMERKQAKVQKIKGSIGPTRAEKAAKIDPLLASIKRTQAHNQAALGSNIKRIEEERTTKMVKALPAFDEIGGFSGTKWTVNQIDAKIARAQKYAAGNESEAASLKKQIAAMGGAAPGKPASMVTSADVKKYEEENKKHEEQVSALEAKRVRTKRAESYFYKESERTAAVASRAQHESQYRQGGPGDPWGDTAYKGPNAKDANKAAKDAKASLDRQTKKRIAQDEEMLKLKAKAPRDPGAAYVDPRFTPEGITKSLTQGLRDILPMSGRGAGVPIPMRPPGMKYPEPAAPEKSLMEKAKDFFSVENIPSMIAGIADMGEKAGIKPRLSREDRQEKLAQRQFDKDKEVRFKRGLEVTGRRHGFGSKRYKEASGKFRDMQENMRLARGGKPRTPEQLERQKKLDQRRRLMEENLAGKRELGMTGRKFGFKSKEYRDKRVEFKAGIEKRRDILKGISPAATGGVDAEGKPISAAPGMAAPAVGTGPGMSAESQAMMSASTVSSATVVFGELNITIDHLDGMGDLANQVVAKVESAVTGQRNIMAGIMGQTSDPTNVSA
jgi:hypothetical protein